MDRNNAPNWLQRNWKWLLPSGCLVLVVLTLAFFFAVLFLVFRLMRTADVYQQALDRARHDPALVAALGANIEDGYFMSGNVTENSGGSGSAKMTIPLSGPKGSATLYLVARKSHGAWAFSRLEAEIESTRQKIDVLHGAP